MGIEAIALDNVGVIGPLEADRVGDPALAETPLEPGRFYLSTDRHNRHNELRQNRLR